MFPRLLMLLGPNIRENLCKKHGFSMRVKIGWPYEGEQHKIMDDSEHQPEALWQGSNACASSSPRKHRMGYLSWLEYMQKVNSKQPKLRSMDRYLKTSLFCSGTKVNFAFYVLKINNFRTVHNGYNSLCLEIGPQYVNPPPSWCFFSEPSFNLALRASSTGGS